MNSEDGKRKEKVRWLYNIACGRSSVYVLFRNSWLESSADFRLPSSCKYATSCSINDSPYSFRSEEEMMLLLRPCSTWD